MAHTNTVQIQKYLRDMDYPATKEQIIRHAQMNYADQNILDALEEIPDDDYETPADVGEALGSAQ